MNGFKRFIRYMLFVVIFILGCSKGQVQVVELRHYPVDSLEGIISVSEAELDREISSDGNADP